MGSIGFFRDARALSRRLSMPVDIIYPVNRAMRNQLLLVTTDENRIFKELSANQIIGYPMRRQGAHLLSPLALSKKHIHDITMKRSTSGQPLQKRQTVKAYRALENDTY